MYPFVLLKETALDRAWVALQRIVVRCYRLQADYAGDVLAGFLLGGLGLIVNSGISSLTIMMSIPDLLIVVITLCMISPMGLGAERFKQAT